MTDLPDMPGSTAWHRYLPASLWFAAFAVFTAVTLAGWTGAFDQAGLLLFRDAGDPDRTLGPDGLALLVGVLTEAGGTLPATALAAVLAAMVWRRESRASALRIVLAFVLWIALVAMLKYAVARPRPELVMALTETSTPGYPSGHAGRAALLFALFAHWLPRLFPLPRQPVVVACYAVIFVVGLSRVFLGVHWPSDVIAAWLLAAVWITAWWPPVPRSRAGNPGAEKEHESER